MSTNSPLRVLLVTPDYPPVLGGIQTLLREMVRSMPMTSTRVVTRWHEGAADYDDQCLERIVRYGSGGQFHQVFELIYFMLRVATLKARDFDPDVVLCGHVVVSPAAWILAKRLRAPMVLYTYGKEVAARPRLTRWAVARSSTVVAISEHTRRQVLEHSRPFCRSKVTIVNPGVRVPKSGKSAPKADRPTLVTLGRLRDRYKGHDMVLQAMPAVAAAVPDVQWIVVGDGPLRSSLESEARHLQLQHCVRFIGSADDDLRDLWLQRAHVFVMPTRYPQGEVAGEGFGIVYLEAAVWGTPSICGRDGGPAEAVVHDVTGLHVDSDSPAQIADAIIQLLTSPTRARVMGLAAMQRARAQFDWSRVAADLSAVLRSAC